jgi:chromosome segregation ATPase
MQDNMIRQGREITSLEMKSHALSRKKHYESELKSTMLRLRGTFADVILGTKKELQETINQSFAAQTDDMEMSFAVRLADMEKKLIQKFTKKAIDAEHSFSKQLKERDSSLAKMKADMEFSEAKKIEELQNSYAKMLESQQASTSMEMTHSRNQLSQAEQAVYQLHTQINQMQDDLRREQAHSCELETAKNMAQNQLSQERDSNNQRIASIERAREETVSKLSSTLQTLETTCASTQRLETRLHDTEAIIHEMEQQLSLNEERASALQHKLDNEVKNKLALINVQTEMERHLNLERERADLLQQKVDASQEVDFQRRRELDRASQENTLLKNRLDQLSGELDRASKENLHLKNELDGADQQLGRELDRASQDNRILKNELDRLVGELVLSSEENKRLKQLSDELDRASQNNEVLKNEHDHLVGELDRSSQENKRLKSELERWGEDNMRIKSESDRFSQHLQIANEVGSTLKNKLTEMQAKFEEQVQMSQASSSECLKLTRKCEELNLKLDNIIEINSLLEVKVERLEATIQDQMIDMEAARMSEAEVEKSLADSLQYGSELDNVARNLDTELKKTLSEYEKVKEQLGLVSHEKDKRLKQLGEELDRASQDNRILKNELDNITEIKSLLEVKVERLEATMQDQMIDMEAARMSEAEVEKSLADSLQYGRELDNVARNLDTELKKTLSEYEKVKEQLGLVSHEKGELAVAYEEVTMELEALKLKRAEDEHAYNHERNEITGALACFDSEMSNAEEKLSSVLQLNANLESEVASLRTQLESDKHAENMKLSNAQIVIETLQDEVRQLVQTFKEKEETLKKNMQDEINNLEEQFVMVNDELNAQVSKYDADIGVYEEAIRMLRDQVDFIQNLADNQYSRCEKCAQNDDDVESRIVASTLEGMEEEMEAMQDMLKDTMKEKLKERLEDELNETLKREMKEELKDAMKKELKEEMKVELREAMKEEGRQEFRPRIKQERLAEAYMSSDVEKVNAISREYDILQREMDSSHEKLEQELSTQSSNTSHDSIRDEGTDVIEVVSRAPDSSGERCIYLLYY